MKAPVDFIARVLISVLFLYSAYLKIADYDLQQAFAHNDFGTNQWDFSVPEWMFWIAIAFEIVAGIALIAGAWTRVVAFLLAGYTLVTALIFHTIGAFDGYEVQQTFNFLKNLAIIGGLLILIVNGPGAWSVDARRRRY